MKIYVNIVVRGFSYKMDSYWAALGFETQHFRVRDTKLYSFYLVQSN